MKRRGFFGLLALGALSVDASAIRIAAPAFTPSQTVPAGVSIPWEVKMAQSQAWNRADLPR
ncbi:MAG: hypothetical protein ABIX11_12120 [Casimicrobiaceae bacterium]